MSALPSNLSAALCDITVNCSIGEEWAWSVCDVEGCRTSQRSNRKVVINIFTDDTSVVCRGKNVVVQFTRANGLLPTGCPGHQVSHVTSAFHLPDAPDTDPPFRSPVVFEILQGRWDLLDLTEQLDVKRPQRTTRGRQRAPNGTCKSSFSPGLDPLWFCPRGPCPGDPGDTLISTLYKNGPEWVGVSVEDLPHVTQQITRVRCSAPSPEVAKPKAHLSKDSPVEGSVTLTCSVGSSSSSSSSGWKFFWYKDKKTSEPLNLQSRRIPPSGGGVYWCRGGRGDPVYNTEYSHPVVTNRAVVTLQHDWPEIYSGETITLTCGIKEGGGSEWEYEWRTPDYYTPQNPRGSMMTSSVPGDYRCKGRLKDEDSTTEWSDAFTLTTSDVPQSVLTVSPSWTSPGDSVTLTCSVGPPSAGWRFFWYKAVHKLSLYNYTYELLAGSTTGTEQGSYVLHGQTHTAGYVCRAGRGDPVIYTLYSDVKFVSSGGVNPAASLTVSPHRLQHFSTESLSLSCEGTSTEWRVMKADGSGFMSSCSYWGEMTGSTCNTSTRASSGVYWCESETQCSNAANITIHRGDVILVSPVRPVTEGHSVSLGCELRTKELLDDVDFYKDDKLLPNAVRGKLFISAVNKSHEGFYKCRGRKSPQGFKTLTSAESWLSVEYPEEAASSSVFLVMLVVVLVSGVLLILLLLLFLCLYRKWKHDEPEESPVHSDVRVASAAGTGSALLLIDRFL
ncbi:uncharacterized protein LOC119221785 [Pungitius pungitius]|uniref:uncharacterized protein LOC119221785 n=1 Tax=Pungitius pungitius TaxID=134920 RepID=UPI002E0DF36E